MLFEARLQPGGGHFAPGRGGRSAHLGAVLHCLGKDVADA